jgi:hypothetical protein
MTDGVIRVISDMETMQAINDLFHVTSRVASATCLLTWTRIFPLVVNEPTIVLFSVIGGCSCFSLTSLRGGRSIIYVTDRIRAFNPS